MKAGSMGLCTDVCRPAGGCFFSPSPCCSDAKGVAWCEEGDDSGSRRLSRDPVSQMALLFASPLPLWRYRINSPEWTQPSGTLHACLMAELEFPLSGTCQCFLVSQVLCSLCHTNWLPLKHNGEL